MKIYNDYRENLSPKEQLDDCLSCVGLALSFHYTVILCVIIFSILVFLAEKANLDVIPLLTWVGEKSKIIFAISFIMLLVLSKIQKDKNSIYTQDKYHNPIEILNIIQCNPAKANVISKEDIRVVLAYALNFNSDSETINLLLDYVEDVNFKEEDGSTYLHTVSYKNSRHIKILLEAGANIEAKDNKGRTPLDFAFERRALPGVKVLLDNGANISLTDTEMHDFLFDIIKEGNASLIHSLIKRKVNINQTDEHSRTPLHLCVNKRSAAKVLIENGASLNAQDNEGNTPLHYAINRQSIKLLIKRGADPNIKNNEGISPKEKIDKLSIE